MKLLARLVVAAACALAVTLCVVAIVWLVRVTFAL